jgi:serine/threonine protein kinase
MALSLSEFESAPRTLLQQNSGIKARVVRVDAEDGRYIVKETSHLRPPARWLANWLLKRERRALAALANCAAVPTVVFERPGAYFAYRMIEGELLTREVFNRDPRGLTVKLATLVEDLHDQGVFHLDLHQRKNLLVDEAGDLHVLDFGSALRPGVVGRALFGWLLAYVDRQAELKYLARFAPEHLTQQEMRAIARRLWLRRLWFFTPHRLKGEKRALREHDGGR